MAAFTQVSGVPPFSHGFPRHRIILLTNCSPVRNLFCELWRKWPSCTSTGNVVPYHASTLRSVLLLMRHGTFSTARLLACSTPSARQMANL